jgi:hypothetical protein
MLRKPLRLLILTESSFAGVTGLKNKKPFCWRKAF